MSDQQSLRIVVLKEGDAFVAQCLEYDICAQAPDVETLRVRMNDLIDLECRASLDETGLEFGGIDAAPEKFHKMWDDANRIDSPGSRLDMALAA